MAVLTFPQSCIVEDARRDARRWCAGHTIDGAPAEEHGVQVALVLSEHLAGAPPELIAAALLHNAPAFGPPDIDDVLTARHGPEVARLVRALHDEHSAPAVDDLSVVDDRVLLAATAHMIVALISAISRARASGDARTFLATARRDLVQHIPYFRAVYAAGTRRVPPSMSAHFGDALATITRLVGGRRP